MKSCFRLEAGADDVTVNEDVFEITRPAGFAQVKQELEAVGMKFVGAELS